MIRYLQPRTNVTNPYIVNDDQHYKLTDIGYYDIVYCKYIFIFKLIVFEYHINKILKSLNVYGKFVWYLYQPF